MYIFQPMDKDEKINYLKTKNKELCEELILIRRINSYTNNRDLEEIVINEIKANKAMIDLGKLSD